MTFQIRLTCSHQLVENTGTTPNGVVIDADGSRAVVVNWGGNADILGVDIATGEVTTLVDGSGLVTVTESTLILKALLRKLLNLLDNKVLT